MHRRAALGDVLLITPVLKALRRKYPEYEIVVTTEYPEILLGNPFVDLVTTAGARQSGVHGDDVSDPSIPLGFNFTFYGHTFSTVNMTTNFWMSFTYPGRDYSFSPLPSTQIPYAVMPLAMDGYVGSGASMWTDTLGAGPSARFIAEWVTSSRCCSPETGPLTFEAILRADGTIDFVYKSITTVANQALIAVNQGDGAHSSSAPGSGGTAPAPGTDFHFVFNGATGNYDISGGVGTTAASYTAYSGPISVGGQGSHTVLFYSADATGAQEQPQQTIFTIDTRGTVTGSVVDNGLQPVGVGGVRVGTQDGSGNWLVSTLTASDGSYSLHLLPGPYTIYSGALGNYHAGTPVTGIVVSTAATTAGVNFTANRWAFITGTLVDTSGAGVGGLAVTGVYGCCPNLTFQAITSSQPGSVGAFDLQVDSGPYSVQTVSTACGFSPTARRRRPKRVR